MSDDFYQQLPSLSDFTSITDPDNFTPLPDEWYLVVTDVVSSTQAIAAGRYKEVNMLGAASIVALLNLAAPLDLPFIFGGDGATLAIPPTLVVPARSVLAALRSLAQRSYQLELRAGIVPIEMVNRHAQPVTVARIEVDEHYSQAAFSGGLAYVENILKDPVAGAGFLVTEISTPEAADLRGLECRWQDLVSRHGEIINLIVIPIAKEAPTRTSTLRAFFALIETIYGSDQNYHPVSIEQLQTTASPRALMIESRLRARPGLMARLDYLLRIWSMNLLVGLYKQYQVLTGHPPWWNAYRALAFRTTDYRKFDGALRMVIASTPAQRMQLETYLDAQYQHGELVYGLHVTDRAILTCLVFERMGHQVHLVDGADGGYALASHALKQRLSGSGP
ncbi:DUF3095 domain-containing protein [Candidatus Chloroploca sp. Khr17]|uniref:DUF3095 domain-containing protein n=1 Tax=Candidatus Chloroploca sp. Khr17 TaxID=2496869 RepID=UPI00101BB098|nr:DUF3095 domain-containing protein [Candidatus Chloroploca sp. Khr17]